ncbi:MAG TPA: thioredoxin [Anaerolineales bacterium]|nr:thioredoxin [Anaerolineales bacterium]
MTGDYIMRVFYDILIFRLRANPKTDCHKEYADQGEKNRRYMIMSNEPIHVTDAAFEKTVLQSPIPVIVDFWAPWCNPCKMVAPTLDKLAKEYEGKILIAKVNTDENPDWMMKYGIQGIPTMLFVSNGKIVHRQVGALPERMLRDVVTQFMEVVSQP